MMPSKHWGRLTILIGFVSWALTNIMTGSSCCFQENDRNSWHRCLCHSLPKHFSRLLCIYLHHHHLLMKSWAVIAACRWNWHNGYLQSLDMEFSRQSDRYFYSICDIVCKLKNVYSWAFIVAVPSDFTNGDDKTFANHADIWDSQADVLASMANYLKNHGWKNGGPLFQKVNFYRKFNIWAMWHTFWCLLTAWKTIFHISNSTTIHHEYYGYH